MTRKYSLVMETGPTDYSAYLLELPTILITGPSVEDLMTRAQQAVRVYFEVQGAVRSPTWELREIEVELPA